MKKILIAEDESSIRELVAINLKKSGYQVLEARDGAEALELYNKNNDIDIALLDIMMPRIDGLEVCEILRHRNPTLGIILLTAKTQERDKVTGLMSGADDYITKPFSPAELMARIESVFRRVAVSKSNLPSALKTETTLGEFVLNIRNRTLSKNGEIIDLTQVEFQIIELFFEYPNAALSRTNILHKVWGESYYGDEKVVDVNIRRLRMKVEDEPSNPIHLVTVWGLGYKWIP